MRDVEVCDFKPRNRFKTIGCAILLSSLVFIGVSISDSAQSVAQDESQIAITVNDQNGNPVDGVKIYAAFISTERKFQKNNPVNRVTDKNGLAKVPIYPKLRLIRFWASKQGYVTLFFNWEEKDVDSIPAEFKITLQKGTQLSGKVVDPAGNPVQGAKIDVMLDSGGEKVDPQERVKLNRWLAEGDDRAVSDKDGIWSINTAPAGTNLKLRFMIEHPDFIKDKRRRDMIDYRVSLEQLRKGTAKFQLAQGAPITGQITGQNGKPVTKGLVIWGDRPYWERGSQEVEIDKEGNYEIPPRPPGKIRVTVVAPGWMPVDRIVDVGNTNQNRQDFTLKEGKKLRLKFVDQQNEVIPKAAVHIKKWHGQEALYNQRHPNIKPTGIPAYANGQGIYTWDWAPDDLLNLVVGNPANGSTRDIDLIANNEIQTIQLQKPFVLSGNVVDAKTGKPIKDYTIVPITYSSPSKTVRGIAQSSWQKSFQDSKFQFAGAIRSGQKELVAFRFQSVGYRDFTTKRFVSNSAPTTATIKLQPSPPRKVKIVMPDGKPATSAKIWVAKPDQGTMVNRFQDYFSNVEEDYIRADKSGKAAFGLPGSRYAIVAASPEGYAEKYLEIDESIDELTLQRWASLEGDVVQNGKPVPGATVIARPIRVFGGDHPHVQDLFSTKTDLKGNFKFEKLPPVPIIVRSPLTPWRDYPITSSRTLPVNLKPGKPHRVTLGGKGLQVIGQVKLVGGDSGKFEFRYGLNNMVRLMSGVKTPPHAQFPNQFETGESKSWTDKLYDGMTPKTTPESFFVKLQDDGSFSVSGVQPGSYRFLIKLYEPPTGCLVEPIGFGFVEFSTDDYQVQNNLINLETIEVKLKPFPKVGDVLPDFRFQQMSGDWQQISSYRGKYVLVDFWASWCKPCIQAFPEIGEFHRSVASAKDIAVLSLSIDKEFDAAKTTAIRQKTAWSVGFAGEAMQNANTKNILGVSSVPTYLVLDPKGKILFRGFSHEQAIEALKKARQ